MRKPRSAENASPAFVVCSEGLVRPWPEAAEFLGIGRSTLYRLLDSGELPYVRVLSDRRIPKRALIEFAEKRLVSCAS